MADKNGNPFFIDFGFDLGEPSGEKKSISKNYLMHKYTDKTYEINKFYK